MSKPKHVESQQSELKTPQTPKNEEFGVRRPRRRNIRKLQAEDATNAKISLAMECPSGLRADTGLSWKQKDSGQMATMGIASQVGSRTAS